MKAPPLPPPVTSFAFETEDRHSLRSQQTLKSWSVSGRVSRWMYWTNFPWSSNQYSNTVQTSVALERLFSLLSLVRGMDYLTRVLKNFLCIMKESTRENICQVSLHDLKTLYAFYSVCVGMCFEASSSVAHWNMICWQLCTLLLPSLLSDRQANITNICKELQRAFHFW